MFGNSRKASPHYAEVTGGCDPLTHSAVVSRLMSQQPTFTPHPYFYLFTKTTHWVSLIEMSELLSYRLKAWRGKLRQKEAAEKLGLPLPTYRKYENGHRTPNALALAELERRMSNATNNPTS